MARKPCGLVRFVVEKVSRNETISNGISVGTAKCVVNLRLICLDLVRFGRGKTYLQIYNSIAA